MTPYEQWADKILKLLDNRDRLWTYSQDDSDLIAAEIARAVEEALAGTITLELHQKIVISRKASAYEDAAKIVESNCRGEAGHHNIPENGLCYTHRLADDIRARAKELK